MELFSVTCITCRTRLKVRHESAIGQILACPKCNGMVQIEPPPGWKSPAKKGSPLAETEEASAGDTATIPPPRHPRPTETAPSATSPSDEASLAPPGMIAAPHEAQARKWILIGGGVLAALVLGFGFWKSFAGRSEPTIDEPIVSASPTKSATRPATSATKPSATPSVSVTASKPTPTAVASASVPATTATAAPSVSATPTVSATASPPPVLIASASPTASPSPSVPPPAATPPSVPAPNVAASKPPQPNPPPAPGPQIDLAARLADKFPELAFEKTPLRQALALLSQISTIRIQYDADSLAAADVKISDPITLKLTAATVEEAITKLAAERGLQFRTVGDQIVVFAPAKDAASSATVVYPIDDLTGNDEAATKSIAELVRHFVVPDAWDERWGGRLEVSPGKLEVTQQAAGQREVAAFLDRLRLARGKTPKSSTATLDTRLGRAHETLEMPVTMNFRPAATLPEIAARIEEATGATLLVNYLELASQGFFGAETIGIAADKTPVERVLGALCEPRDWAWRIVSPKLIEITTRDAVRRRPYVEFYALPAAAELDGPGWMLKIRTALADEAWRDMTGIDPQTAGEVAFDAASQRLIVRQSQGAHARIERLLAESVKSASAPQPAPRVTPSATVPQPSATATGTPLRTAVAP